MAVYGGGAGVGLVVLLVLTIALGVPVLLAWLLSAGAVTFVLYGIDKTQARRGGLRAPERLLLVLGVAGGFVGGFLGMAIWRHKTRHTAFYLANAVGLALALVLALVLPGSVWRW
jgi:uncharacterized membrane protein YsdA (DUF1294 family)